MDDLHQQAQAGNPEAIVALLSRQLAANEITAIATSSDNHLRLILESAEGPSPGWGHAMHQELLQLQMVSFDRVTIISRQTGEVTPRWSQSFNLTAEQ